MKLVLITPFLFAFLLSCGAAPTAETKESWNDANDPSIFQLSLRSYQLDELPLKAYLAPEIYPWSDSYWPTYAGGIGNRWQISPTGYDYRDFQYDFLSEEEIVANNPRVALDLLSPAEKYDILLGRYDFPLAKEERRNQLRAVDPQTDSVPSWFGLCHGWAPATLLEAEPGTVTLTNSDGLDVTFFSSDIKALMTKVYADYSPPQPSVGRRCYTDQHQIERDENGRILLPECRDVNPAAFHLILTDYMARQEGFIVDISFGSEVWNQAVVGYEITEMESYPFDPAGDPAAPYRAPGTTTLVHVKNRLSYVTEIKSAREPNSIDPDRYTRTVPLEYTLELNFRGEIIGGEWASGHTPDFLWRAMKPASGQYLDYAIVSKILEQSRM
jgi:hypothetical protein